MTLAGALSGLLGIGLGVPEPTDLRSFSGGQLDALEPRSRRIIQLELLRLVATPVTHVALSIDAVAHQRNLTDVFITGIVLIMLLYSLARGLTACQSAR